MTPTGPDLLATLNALLRESLNLEGVEREAFLARLRQDHPEHAAELDALVDAEAALDARRFLMGGVSPLDGTGPGLAGQRLGGWTLERPLGQGGMGTVWLARRSDGRFEGTAAIKLLNLALLDPVGAERFRREGSVLARLSHPNIARLLDAGLTEGGQPYLVLEHVEGERIDRYCDERRLPPERRLHLVLEVLAAVAHAHANLIVHRDLKPSNILVTPQGGVKLLDFGIAKLLEEESGAEASMLTDVGGRALTPEYAAPEQASGGSVTTATDVYALGVLLYVLLSGRHPTGEGRQSAADHLRSVVDTEPPRMSAVVAKAEARGLTVERLRRLYAGDLDNIVAKALKKQPEERYRSVGAFADDLGRYLRHEPVRARADSWRYRTAKFVRRNRLPVALGVVAALALVGGIARERELRGRAEAEAGKALAVQDYLVRVFGAPDPSAPAETRPADVTARTLVDREAARIDTALTSQPDVRAELRGALGRLYTNLELYDQAVGQLQRALDERRAIYGARHPAVAATMDQLGLALLRWGRDEPAESLLRASLALRRELLGNQDPATAENMAHLAELLAKRYDPEAEPLLREALAIRRALYGDTSLVVAGSKHSLAMVLIDKGIGGESRALMTDVVKLREQRLGFANNLTAEALNNLGRSEEMLGNYAEAERLLRRAIASWRAALGDSAPSVAAGLNNLGSLLYKATPRAAEAESLLRAALAINRRSLGEHHPSVAIQLSNIEIFARERGDFEESRRLLEAALAIDRRVYGPKSTLAAIDLNGLASILRLSGKPDSAVQILRGAAAEARSVVGDDHLHTLAIRGHLGRALRESGSLGEAEQILRDVLTRLDSTKAEMHSTIVQAQTALGRTLTSTDRPAEALPLLRKALVQGRVLWGPEHYRTAEVELALGLCLAAVDQDGEARPLLRHADALLQKHRRGQPLLAREAATAVRALKPVSGAGVIDPTKVTRTAL